MLFLPLMVIKSQQILVLAVLFWIYVGLYVFFVLFCFSPHNTVATDDATFCKWPLRYVNIIQSSRAVWVCNDNVMLELWVEENDREELKKIIQCFAAESAQKCQGPCIVDTCLLFRSVLTTLTCLTFAGAKSAAATFQQTHKSTHLYKHCCCTQSERDLWSFQGLLVSLTVVCCVGFSVNSVCAVVSDFKILLISAGFCCCCCLPPQPTRPVVT